MRGSKRIGGHEVENYDNSLRSRLFLRREGRRGGKERFTPRLILQHRIAHPGREAFGGKGGGGKDQPTAKAKGGIRTQIGEKRKSSQKSSPKRSNAEHIEQNFSEEGRGGDGSSISAV